MQETIPPQARGRSNSLQRMLDLEKKLNFQRTHQGSVPPSPTVTDSSVPPSPGFPPRRFELVPKDKKVPPPVRNYNAVPPPLFCSHTAPARAESPNILLRKPVGQGASRSVSREASSTDLTADKHQKTVAFMFPPDVEEQRSVCQSPTWEAYDRRKKEKKEEKKKENERKKEDDKKKEQEKEQAMNEALEEAWKNAPKPRGRKLTKNHPPPSALANHGRITIDPARPAQQKRRSRSSSLLGFSIGRNNDEPDEPRHSRSNSLTSLFRNSFEIKRASFDETSSTGFLGGVKLEKKKEDFHQKVLEDQAKGNSKVHPALRKSFLGHGSFTPLKINPQQQQQQPKEADAQRRAYPPISINTAAARGHSAKPSKSPQRRGSVNIYLWSARAKRNSAASECAVADETEDEEDQIQVHTPDSEVLYNKAQGLTRRGGVHIKNGSHTTPDQKQAKGQEEPKAPAQSESSQARPMTAETTQSQRMKEVPPLRIKTPKATEKPAPEEKTSVSKPPVVLAKPQPRPRRASVTSTSTAPEPPRKSSKRSSLVFLTRLQSHSPQDDPSSSKSSFGSPKDKKSMESSRSSKSSKHNPPSIRYEHTSAGERPKPITAESSPVVSSTKWTLKEAAKSAFSRGHSSHGSYSRPSTGVSPDPSAESPRTESSTPLMSNSQPYRGLNITGGVPLDATHSSRPSNKHLSPAMGSPACRPRTSSSESSYSDAIQSVSPLSTPHTTPPQSEMGHSPRMSTVKPVTAADHGYEQVSPYWSWTNSPQLPPSDRFEASDPSSSEADADPIQEAANRVMEAFSNANLRSPTHQRKRLDSSAETSSLASTPTMQMQPPLKHKDRSKSRIRSPVNAHQSPRLDRLGSPLRGHRPTLSDPEASLRSPLRRQRDLEHHHDETPVAKMFVECCECKYYHDMPSKLYEAMSDPDTVLSSTDQLGFAGSVSMTVRCPWCKHEMSTKCCAGFAAMVYIKERFH